MGEPIGCTLFSLFLFLLLLLVTAFASLIAGELGRAEVINGYDYQDVEASLDVPI